MIKGFYQNQVKFALSPYMDKNKQAQQGKSLKQKRIFLSESKKDQEKQQESQQKKQEQQQEQIQYNGELNNDTSVQLASVQQVKEDQTEENLQISVPNLKQYQSNDLQNISKPIQVNSYLNSTKNLSMQNFFKKSKGNKDISSSELRGSRDGKIKQFNYSNDSSINNVSGSQAFTNNAGFSRNIRTYARFRPLTPMELNFNENPCVHYVNQNSVIVNYDGGQLYTFDKVYTENQQSQLKIFQDVAKESIEDVMKGYNSTIFAYGPTAGGKTYTMFGNIDDQEQKGIIPRAAKSIFDYVQQHADDDLEFIIIASFLEIYQEKINDLLNLHNVDLKIKESSNKGIYVLGLTEIRVKSVNEIMDLLKIGEASRKIKSTKCNDYSSRSHTIFTIQVSQKFKKVEIRKGKLNLIDLAGSEKLSKSQSIGESLQETKKINFSLSCLGNVINALNHKFAHIPYRDSKLTRILQESLGGNYKTSLIVNLSPHESNLDEIVSTLKFASRAKSVKTEFRQNIINSTTQLKYNLHQVKKQNQNLIVHHIIFQDFVKKILDLKYENQDHRGSEQKLNQIYRYFDDLPPLMNLSITDDDEKFKIKSNASNLSDTEDNFFDGCDDYEIDINALGLMRKSDQYKQENLTLSVQKQINQLKWQVQERDNLINSQKQDQQNLRNQLIENEFKLGFLRQQNNSYQVQNNEMKQQLVEQSNIIQQQLQKIKELDKLSSSNQYKFKLQK